MSTRNVIVNPWGNEMTLDQVTNQVGPGWQNIIKRLIDDLFLLGWDGRLHQIKEKFGGLRFYIGAAPAQVHDRISQAEAESFCTCETCGLPGETRATGNGSLATVCDNHAE